MISFPYAWDRRSSNVLDKIPFWILYILGNSQSEVQLSPVIAIDQKKTTTLETQAQSKQQQSLHRMRMRFAHC